MDILLAANITARDTHPGNKNAFYFVIVNGQPTTFDDAIMGVQFDISHNGRASYEQSAR